MNFRELQEIVGREPVFETGLLLAGDVDPASVRVLGINGGEIAAFEYRLALAMGAKAGIVHKSGDAGDALLPDADWADAGNLLRLPLDNMTLRAFVHSGKALTRMNEKQVDLAGRKVHEHYFRDNAQSLIDSGLQQWEKLREDFKNSNRQQAAYAEQILRACGFGIRSLSKAGGFTQFKPEETERMAEMEHGRWNVERLQAGWQYGEKKDKEKRISPYLVPWAGLSEKIKNYDRRAVQHFPKILREAGLEIFRLPSPRDRRGKNPRKRKLFHVSTACSQD